MAQNRGEIDPHEMFQNELALRDIDSSGAFAVDRRDRLAKLASSPYFARIDFGPAPQDTAPYYIGRFAFSHENELLIFDWRAPVAGMFYDCEVGPAFYQAPRGRVQGVLARKRQFKIANGVMEYALESSDNVRDEVLQRELAATSDEKMKSIIATIQKEQNTIIRSKQAGTLIIQGAAGSGKTSIALHRVAFLMYRQKEELKAQNIVILSPNKVFGDYIAGVLPELGEEPVFSASLADIAGVQLEKLIGFAPDKNPLEANDNAWARRVRKKSTLAFVRLMDQYIAALPQRAFHAREYRIENFMAPADWIEQRLAAYQKLPLLKRLEQVAEDIHDRFETDNVMGHELPRARSILKDLKAMLVYKNTLALYKDFLHWAGLWHLFVMPDKKTLEWNDVFPLLYLHAAFAGLCGSRVIKHLVIDEMQDYTPIQLAVLNRLFPCPKTILGDFGQAINPNHGHTVADILQLYDGAAFEELKTSYRSSWEIIRFAKRICPGADLHAIERHGEEPMVTACGGEREQREEMARLIAAFHAGGGGTMGIILKTDARAQSWYEALKELNGVHLIGPASKRFEGGVCVTSVQMAKGLEFDEVIIPQADAETYHTGHDRSLLYVACTRAMHKLCLLYAGRRSPLLG